MRTIRIPPLLIAFTLILGGCQGLGKNPNSIKERQERPKRVKPAKLSYHFDNGKQWRKKIDSLNKTQLHLLLSINRADRENIPLLDSIVVPDDFDGDIAYYMPFPLDAAALKDVRKIIIFSYRLQAFGAYEYGDLVYTGATNMGRKKDPTPTGLFFTNWKAEESTSTFNDEWNLKWNFNIANKEGVGWHQYAMPGYPASHSCLRLLKEDARYLYTWADTWKIKGANEVLAQGTPVIIFGSYDFDGSQPWHELVTHPRALDLSRSEIKGIVEPFIDKVLDQQQIPEESASTNKN